MELSPKAIRFIIEALEYRIHAYEKRLKMPELEEDEASDITNDMMFLESLCQEFSKTLEISPAKVLRLSQGSAGGENEDYRTVKNSN